MKPVRIDDQFNLQPWADQFRDDFARLHQDPEVMSDLGGQFARAESDAKFDRYSAAWSTHGISRWPVVHVADDRLVGYVGVTYRSDAAHPLGAHYEVGWRLQRAVWGRGLATRGALLAIAHAWTVLSVREILSYTAADNVRSQHVMDRLGLRRDSTRDFVARYPRGEWHGLVWVANRRESGG